MDSFDSDLLQQLSKAKVECVEKIQGEPKLIDYLENNIELRDFLSNQLTQEIYAI